MYFISKIVPVHFTTVYRTNTGKPMLVKWWQWRGRYFRVNRVAI